MKITEAQAKAVALMTSAASDQDACSQLAARLAFAGVDERVLVLFCLTEACWSWSSPAATSTHPVLGPSLRALRAGEDGAARATLVSAMTDRSPGSSAALLVQVAYATVRMVPDIESRLAARGLAIASDPASSALRPAGRSN